MNTQLKPAFDPSAMLRVQDRSGFHDVGKAKALRYISANVET